MEAPEEPIWTAGREEDSWRCYIARIFIYRLMSGSMPMKSASPQATMTTTTISRAFMSLLSKGEASAHGYSWPDAVTERHTGKPCWIEGRDLI